MRLGFAIFWVVMAAQASVVFSLFGIPFVLLGLVFAFGRFIIDAQQRNKTFYRITDKRIIIKSGVFSQTIKSLNIKSLSEIQLTEKADRSGTITIDPKYPFTSFYNGMGWWPGANFGSQLQMIDDARKVYRKIVEIQNG